MKVLAGCSGNEVPLPEVYAIRYLGADPHASEHRAK